MAETTPLPNDPAARSPTGEIREPNQTSTPTTETPSETPSTTEAKPADPTKSLVNEDSSPKGAPEKYADWKAPEGQTIDPKLAAEANDIFRSMNLSQDQGQKLVDFYNAHVKEAVDKPMQAYQDMRKQWRDQTLADPDVGGQNLDQTKSNLSKVLDVYPDQSVVRDFKQKMDLTGAGDILSFIKIFNWMAVRLGEGGFVRANNPAQISRSGQPSRPSLAAAMFPNLPSSSSSG